MAGGGIDRWQARLLIAAEVKSTVRRSESRSLIDDVRQLAERCVPDQ
jgi:hypothetical protein